MSVELERVYPPDTRERFEAALDAELSRRIQSLGESPHTASECCAPTRACFVEAASWGVLGVVIWVATLMYLG
ncbi:erythromycin esterase-like protein (plasmid) [Ensifer sp. WSM1721]|uniref:hypothetical protein n=1 Tax=Ensifer sp. WSM1721 TaxID=1041159 RepID=UPI00047D5D9C|nr:hypothetical protein [Ensifer sp. WSM1721]